ncbi:hypothetical protein OKW50_003477 [Paraburkholderia youngii]|uniref:hypothetical protein n=1 Tax=Paraburkholderia youngii TaxID=2782701 RepID=UPI003D22FC80
MPSLVDEHSHLRAADDRLRTAVHLISAQEDRLARYRAACLDTQLSEELLFTMHAILRSFIAHRLTERQMKAALPAVVELNIKRPREGTSSGTPFAMLRMPSL